MKPIINIATALFFTLLTPLSAKSAEQMCKVRDPNDTYVNRRYPANGALMSSLPNESWVWVDPNGSVYDKHGRPWTATINQRSRSPINIEYVISKFVYECRAGSPFSEWFIQLNQ